MRRHGDAGTRGLGAGDRPTPPSCTASSATPARSVAPAGAGELGAEGERGTDGEGVGERGHEGERESGTDDGDPRGDSVSAGGRRVAWCSGGGWPLTRPFLRATAWVSATSTEGAARRPARRRHESW